MGSSAESWFLPRFLTDLIKHLFGDFKEFFFATVNAVGFPAGDFKALLYVQMLWNYLYCQNG